MIFVTDSYIPITVLFHVAFVILEAIVFINYEYKMIKKIRHKFKNE